ncbi:hypothetical protein PV04_01409 [Phialophora macrospora]|uniref:RING-type domain-containing protein n=1 Tax=Phialophora macrospora TaxID=1851006 RepID=A0A0D2EFY5_9EURO|nr:hypothetical protein PV04_01409 [Phialophora macrospora]
MACSLVSRLFNHGPLRRFLSRAPPSTTLNNSNPVSQPAAATFPRVDNTSTHPDCDLFLLHAMAGQGTPHLVVRQVILDPNRPVAEVDQVFYSSEGYVGLRLIQPVTGQDNDPARRDLIYTFSTAADAMTALLNHPTITIGEAQYIPELYDVDSAESRTDQQTAQPDTDISPPAKRQKKEHPPADEKILCRICFTELEGLYSTPCRRCKGIECYECVATRFRTAVKDVNHMPVTCCGSVMHHDVARGLLPPAELEEYKQKYDERINTVDPLYCPVPTCSTFLPPRMFNHNDSKVSCHVCSTVVCTKCKLSAGNEHTCDMKEDSRKFILQTFHYKLCPRCGTGVMKMYGCSHIRCLCGAHWCWDCLRPMNACNQKPCSSVGNEEDYSVDEDVESDEESPATVPVAEPVADILTTHSEIERDVADALNTLRNGPALGSRGTVDTSNSVTDPEIISPPVIAPGPETAPVDPPMAELGMSDLTRSSTDMTPTDLGVSITGPSELVAIVPPDTSNAQGNSDATQEAVVTQGAVTNEQAGSQVDIPPPPQPATAVVTAETTAPELPSDNLDSAAAATENLDDPFVLEWEGTDLDFGGEPTDESTDIWGCRHHFYEFRKDRLPQFWLPGVRPATDASLEIECMGCFKKTKVWDDDTELEAFRMKYCSNDELQLEKDALRQKFANWKKAQEQHAESPLKELKAGSALKSHHAVECRNGCGVVYCRACKNEARRKMRKERRADA